MTLECESFTCIYPVILECWGEQPDRSGIVQDGVIEVTSKLDSGASGSLESQGQKTNQASGRNEPHLLCLITQGPIILSSPDSCDQFGSYINKKIEDKEIGCWWQSLGMCTFWLVFLSFHWATHCENQVTWWRSWLRETPPMKKDSAVWKVCEFSDLLLTLTNTLQPCWV